jgi:hypothetical protein
MSSTRPVSPTDVTASDIFASPRVAGRLGAGLGLDVECTKAAVDLQNMVPQTSESVIQGSLETLRRATGADTAFIAMLNETGEGFARITAAGAEGVAPGARGLSGEPLTSFPFLASRFDHLRLTEYRDTSAPAREDPAEAGRLAALGFSSVLLVVLYMHKRPAGVLGVARCIERGAWDVNYQLLLKLSAPASPRALIARRYALAEMDERNARVDAASTMVCGISTRLNELYLSPRWKR